MNEKIHDGAGLVVLLLWFVGMFNYFDRQLITTMGEPVMDAFRVDARSFGLISSLYLWVYAFFRRWPVIWPTASVMPGL